MRRVALLLNRNAQRVTPELVAWARSAAARPGDVFATATLEEARAAAEAILAGGYGAVCVGGGDGTFSRAAQDFLALAPDHVPALLPLRLGGGNAIHDVCGASPPTPAGLLSDLARAGGDEAPAPLRLIEVEGRLAHFVGTGIDAKHIEDFDALIKGKLRNGPLRPLSRGIPAIVLTVLLRTLPRLVLEPRLCARIVSTGAAAERLDDAGRPTGDPLPEGAVLYDGDITIMAAATVSQYSRDITFFPFADALSDRFQLRVSSAGPAEVLLHLPSVFDGTYRNPRTLLDFAVTGARIELSLPSPFHIGGDLQAAAGAFTMALSPHVVPVLRRPGGARSAPPAPRP
ncbi:uncharacterized protein SOCE26_054160 [Sorangium cellulosum]|uniref:DAGKc domain-containing protein n=1 Tax=Sorangium cellulosum TaxID=56 RepID=A0A2L0EXI8_SORCE|nr:diacylglycerol kinase family protein [Sorangium cellulosum]AUX43959.1 uncharacterized protein SOCE26_054160 [Sorangium cellulosum]